MRDRRRFRNLLLDAVSSDAMPLAELLLRAHDDGMLRALPDRRAARSVWDTAAARLASDLQTQRFVEPGIARFVADAWVNALGPDVVPSARVASPRPTVAPRMAPPRAPASAGPTAGSSGSASRAPAPAPAPASSANSAASIRAYRRSNQMLLGFGVVFTLLTVFAFWDTNRRAERKVDASSDGGPPRTTTPAGAMPEPASNTTAEAPTEQAPAPRRPFDAVPPPPIVVERVPTAADSVSAVTRPPVEIAPSAARATDDIVLTSGRVFEGRVLSVRQQNIVVRDEESGLEFEIAKAEVDRVVTRDGRIMRFGDDNVSVMGSDGDLTPMAHAGRYRVRYAERWGAERGECRDMARRFAPGVDLMVRHLRGAPMLRLEFLGGQGYNAAVRPDGLFESGTDVAPVRGPQNAFVSTRVSGRITRGGVLQGVARLTASTQDGRIVCDLALTMRGERQP